MGFRARRDDRSTLESVMGMLAGLAERSAMAAQGLKLARELRGRCREDGTLRDAERAALERLVMGIEGALG
jgi:hypothetical protein